MNRWEFGDTKDTIALWGTITLVIGFFLGLFIYGLMMDARLHGAELNRCIQQHGGHETMRQYCIEEMLR